MCGIFGVISKPNFFSETKLKSALNKISHRGPDDWGLEKFSKNNEWDVWFGQRRLSILDLTASGHQPMKHHCQKGFVSSIVFNGEIYNFQDLKKTISSKWVFNSSTDTEIILAGLNLFGSKIFKELNGMMSLAYFDQEKGKVIFARDRLGKKPFYIYKMKDLIVFSSELKAIVELGLTLTLDEESLAFYRWFGYIPAQFSIYKECKKLSAASFLEIDLNNNELKFGQEQLYWDPLNGYGKTYKYTYEEAIEEFLGLLDDATRIRLISDVPVGAFLSGGIDSSLVLSSIKKLNKIDTKVFTVKFTNKDYDESAIAEKTAQSFDFLINFLQLNQSEFDAQIAKIPFHYDEPFSDSSQIPTMAISEIAKKSVSVVLTGDGGDEVFLGYPRFSYTKKIFQIIKMLSIIPFSKSLIHNLLMSNFGDKFFCYLLKMFSVNITNLDAKKSKINEILKSKEIFALYDIIMSINNKSLLNLNDQNFINKKPNYLEYIKSFYPNYAWSVLESRSIEEKLAALDLVSYLRDDVLVKVDRGTMAYSLEARSPLLDYRIVEFGTSLPLEYKIRNGVYKSILRDALATRLKGDVLSLKKKGFGVPLPSNLPADSSLASSWNLFIEKEWRKTFFV